MGCGHGRSIGGGALWKGVNEVQRRVYSGDSVERTRGMEFIVTNEVWRVRDKGKEVQGRLNGL